MTCMLFLLLVFYKHRTSMLIMLINYFNYFNNVPYHVSRITGKEKKVFTIASAVIFPDPPQENVENPPLTIAKLK